MTFLDRYGHSLVTSILGGSFAIATPFVIPTNPNFEPKSGIENSIAKDTFQHEAPKNILVLDHFSEPDISVDIDLVSDITHGEVVSKIIEKGLPNANVEKMHVPSDAIQSDFNKLGQNLTQIFHDTKQGTKKYDAINISLGIEMTFDEAKKRFGIILTPENIASKARELKDSLLAKRTERKCYDDKMYSNAINVIDDLDSISSTGTKVYVAAGNSMNEKINLFSLIDNSVSVGALTPNNTKSFYTADNSLVNRWENGTLNMKKLNGGITWTDDNTPDIEKKHISNIFQKASVFPIVGTSFASPRAIVKDLKEEK